VTLPGRKKSERRNRAKKQHQARENGLVGKHDYFLLRGRLAVKSIKLREQVGILVEVL
jgi:hypothetical protein